MDNRPSFVDKQQQSGIVEAADRNTYIVIGMFLVAIVIMILLIFFRGSANDGSTVDDADSSSSSSVDGFNLKDAIKQLEERQKKLST